MLPFARRCSDTRWRRSHAAGLANASIRPVSRRSVRFTGRIDAFANPAACERRQRVSLQRRAKGSTTYRTFKFVRTRSNGGFSTTTKPMRTYVYRARVGRTSECQGAVSNRELIMVALRKRR